jgi:hypothetical protein
MDRKRKASNATPSTNTDGSATKKIKLVVRVPLLYTLLRAMGRMGRSRAGERRISVFICVV